MAEARAAVKLAVVQAVGLVVARETAMRADEVVLVVAKAAEGMAAAAMVAAEMEAEMGAAVTVAVARAAVAMAEKAEGGTLRRR